MEQMKKDSQSQKGQASDELNGQKPDKRSDEKKALRKLALAAMAFKATE